MNWKLFGALMLLCALGMVSTIPYNLALEPHSPRVMPLSLPVLLIAQLAANAILYALAIYLGLRLGRGLFPIAPYVEAFLDKKSLPPPGGWARYLGLAVGAGLLVGLIVWGLESMMLMNILGPVTKLPQPEAWKGLLAALYGGINEEVQLRLFVQTLFAWALYRFLKASGPLPPGIAWSSIVFGALIFGLGHLPMASELAPTPGLFIIRIVALNALSSLVMGWLYWKKGLEAAMLAHVSADLVLHGLAPWISPTVRYSFLQ